MYFCNYKKLIYLAQTENQELTEKAQECADRLGFSYERIFTGYGEMETELKNISTHIINSDFLMGEPTMEKIA